MKIVKKFFALSLATVTLAGAVYYVTPVMKALGQDRYSFNVETGEYELDANGTTVIQNGKYVQVEEKVTPEKQAQEQWSPADDARYQEWLANWGGGTAAAAGTETTAIVGAIGQPGSEVIVAGAATPTGQPVAMFQSNDATNTLLAAPVGLVPSGSKLTTTESAAIDAAKAAVKKGTVAKVYDIALVGPDGQAAALAGKVAISIPVPADLTVPAGKTLKAYSIVDGKATEIECIIDNGRIVFGTNAVGTIALAIE